MPSFVSALKFTAAAMTNAVRFINFSTENVVTDKSLRMDKGTKVKRYTVSGATQAASGNTVAQANEIVQNLN